MHWKKYILYRYGLSAEGAKASGKKKKGLTILPFSMVQYFSVLFSFFFFQIFSYDQVDRLFQMSHSDISPSLMVLLCWPCNWFVCLCPCRCVILCLCVRANVFLLDFQNEIECHFYLVCTICSCVHMFACLASVGLV